MKKKLEKQYSGENSKKFWDTINSIDKKHSEAYSLGVALQNTEHDILQKIEFCIDEEPTKEQLLEKASKDYVEGVRYICLVDGEEYESIGEFRYNIDKTIDTIRLRNNSRYAQGTIFDPDTKRWAKILKTPVIKVQNKWLYENDEYYEIHEPDFILKKQTAQKGVSEHYESDSKFKQFLTKNSALDYVLKEAIKQPAKKLYLTRSEDDRDILIRTNFFGSTTCIWTEDNGWTAEPIKEEVPEWVMIIIKDYHSDIASFKPYEVKRTFKTGVEIIDDKRDVHFIYNSESRLATRPEIAAHKLGFHIGDEVFSKYSDTIVAISDFYYDSCNELCFNGRYLLDSFTKEDPNKLMLGKHEVELIHAGFDKSLPVSQIKANGGQVTKEEWMDFCEALKTIIELKFQPCDLYANSGDGLEFQLCAIKGVTIAQIEAITNKLNDL